MEREGSQVADWMVGWVGRWFLNLVIAWLRKAQAEPIKVYKGTSWSRALPLVRFTSIWDMVPSMEEYSVHAH